MPLMAASGNQAVIREDDRTFKAIFVTTKWLIKTSAVTIDVRGYSDEIYACVSWPELFDADKDIVRLQLTAHDPHFTLDTINIEGTECETTDFVWHTLMNTVRWWCKSKEWVRIDFEPDADFTIVIPKESCEFVNLLRRLQFVFVAVPMLLGVKYTKKVAYLANPHMVFTDNCQDLRYLSETAGNAMTTRSGSVGELSGSSSSTGRSDHPRGLDRLTRLGSAQLMWLDEWALDEEVVETYWPVGRE